MFLRQFAHFLFGLFFLASSSIAFCNTQFNYNVIEDGIEVTGCVGECPSDLIIPAEIDGYAVSRIGESAFSYSQLTTVVIPESVNYIESIAFEGNQLSKVTIPSGVTKIEPWAFAANKLTNVIISEGVDSIGYKAFEINQLVSITIPSSVTRVDSSVFVGNPLSKAYFLGNRPELSSVFLETQIEKIFYCPEVMGWPGGQIDGITPQIMEECGTEYTYVVVDEGIEITGCVNECPIHIEIPASIDGLNVVSIAEFAFESKGIDSVIFPEGLKKIKRGAFGNNMLSSIVLPNSLEYLSGFDSNQISALNIPINVTHIGLDAFAENDLESIYIPNSVSAIDVGAFRTNSIVQVDMPVGINLIGGYAFEGNQIETLVIPETVSDIGEAAFMGNNISTLVFFGDRPNLHFASFDNNSKEVFFCENTTGWPGETIDGIVPQLVDNCIVISSATAFTYNVIDDGVEITGCVYECPMDLVIPNEIYGKPVTKIGIGAFYKNELNSIDIKDGVSSIGGFAFSNNHLTSLVIPNTVKSIEISAFQHNQLNSLSIRDGLTELQDSVFQGNELETVVIPTSVNIINGDAFANNRLTNIEIPLGIDALNLDAFRGNNLDRIRFLGDRPIITAFSQHYVLPADLAFYYCEGTTGWPGEPINGITPQLDENCDSQSDSDSDSDGDGILDSVDPDPLDSELLYYSVSDIPNLVPDQTLRDCLTNLASGAEGLGHISVVYCSSRNDDAEDLTPIASLEGLQYFPNLTHLWIDSSEISSLAPISNLIKLVSLTVDNGQNSVSDLTPLSALNNLELLHLQNGSLTDDTLQPITQLPKLKQLGLAYNQIEDISFLTSLGGDIEELNVASNPIQDFSPVTSLTSLKKFYGYYNSINNLNFLSNLQNLEVIGISETGTSDIIVLKDLPNLIDVTLNGNPIRRVSGIFTNMQSGAININNTQIWCHEYDDLMAEIATDVEVIYDSSCILDSDQDGFSDQFETDYGLDPFAATFDIDEDGIANEDDNDNDNDGLPDEHDFAPFDAANESASVIVFESGTVGPEWNDGIRAYDESINWSSCLVPEGCPSIDWAIVNDEERGDVLEVTHLVSDSGAGIFISASDSVDLRGARENGVLRFDIKALQDDIELLISADCEWPCAGGQQRVQVSNQNEWQSLFISVQDLIPNGPNGNQLDLNIVKSAIVIEVGQGSSFRIDNIIYDCQSATCEGSNLPINEDAEFSYEFIEDGIELTGCQGQCPSELIIPESIDGYAVTSIGYRAFYSNQSSDYSSRINTVHIPSSIKVIGAGAFQHNRLETLTIPDGVVRIEDQAFLNNRLTSVILPDSINFIGSGAFLANNLTSINNLNQSIIFGGGDQGSFDVNPGIDNGEWRYFPLLDEMILFGCSQECSTDLVIPEYIDDLKVIRIGEGAFANQQLNSVIIPPNVSQIGVFAFAENNLTTVNLPVDLELISHGAFESNPLQDIYYCDEIYDGGVIEGITPQYNDSCDLGQGNDDVSSPYQSVAITGGAVGLLGENLQLTVSYDVSDGEDDLTGLGLRMHYDSSVLSFVTFDSVLESNNISAIGPIQDTQDIDNDSSTDQYISASWASLYIDWPGGLPADLFNAIFEVSNNETLSQTNINFSAISTTAGYGFSGEPYSLNIVAGSWDFDGNGAVDALTDGLLLLRHAFGLSGSALTDFAVSPDSPNTAAEIETHMNRIMSIADIDGDGNVDALTDGLLLLRYAFELRGDNLVANVISDNATRTSSADIESYIEAHMP